MSDLLAIVLLGFASALVPVLNIEAYLAIREAVSEVDSVWVIALAAALGQMVGKLLWYQIGASSLGWGWVRRRAERPKAQARLELWRNRTHERPVLAGGLVLFSAFTGVPPFAVLAVLAGQLRMSLALFLGLGLAGRWLRFALVLGGTSWLESIGLF